jgi:hypothetical protein
MHKFKEAHIRRGLVSPESYILLKYTLQSSRGEFSDCIDLFAQETALFILCCDYAFTCAWSLICFNWIPISGFIFHCVLTIAESSSSGMRLEGYAGIYSTLQHASTRNNLLNLVSTARTPWHIAQRNTHPSIPVSQNPKTKIQGQTETNRLRVLLPHQNLAVGVLGSFVAIILGRHCRQRERKTQQLCKRRVETFQAIKTGRRMNKNSHGDKNQDWLTKVTINFTDCVFPGCWDAWHLRWICTRITGCSQTS